ncbi:MAG: hypothetical protein ACPIOQ_51250, partial [Promethearchaeia archaeon]
MAVSASVDVSEVRQADCAKEHLTPSVEMEDEEGDALEIELSDGDDAAPDPALSELQEVHAPDPHGSIAGGCEEQDEGVRGHNVTSDSDGLEVDLEESEPEGASLEDRGMRQGMEGDGTGAGAGDASEVIVVPDGNVGEKRALKRSEMDEVSTHFKRGKKVAGGEGLTRNLAKVKLHEMTAEEMQAIISFPPPQRGLASKQRLAINMQHPRVLEPPFAADLTRYVHAQLDALLSAGAKFLWTDRCSGFLAFCANLSCLFTGREATGVSVAKLGRFMTTDRELNQKLLTLVQRLLFAPEVAAHVSSSCAAGGTGGGRPEVEGAPGICLQRCSRVWGLCDCEERCVSAGDLPASVLPRARWCRCTYHAGFGAGAGGWRAADGSVPSVARPSR